MVIGGDPVKLGVVTTLSKPGRNVTGVTFISGDLNGKRLEILREIVPGIRRIGWVYNPASSTEVAGISSDDPTIAAIASGRSDPIVGTPAILLSPA